MRARSKSAVTISRGLVHVSEIVPAVPPRRASLGILNRTNSALTKSAVKCNLKVLKESSNTKNQNEVNSDESSERKLSESEENLNERTYMVLEPEPGHEYALPNKSKFVTSTEKETGEKPPVRMTMRERLKQLAQSSEDEIDHNDDSDLSPAMDKHNSALVKELVNSLQAETPQDDPESTQPDTGQQVVTVKFSAEGGMLSADDAQVTTGRVVADGKKDCATEANRNDKAEARFKIKPGTDAMGYTKLLHFDEREKNEKTSDDVKTNTKSSGSFISYLPLEPSRSKSESDTSGCSSQSPTPPVRASWVS